MVINVLYNNLLINDVQKASKQQNNQTPQVKAAGGFQQVLENKIEENSQIQFSKHASLRLSARNIQLSVDQIKRVESGMQKAREKGIRDSLVMVDDVALVVNVNSKTVITAINSDKENVFTNIDGAVIV